ncbi:MAG TPA: 3-isopropylmalate dehydrogenase [Candidatus Obscuribacterales bacterium]
MKKHIAVLPGDGIGEEVMEQALRILSAVADRFGHQFSTTHGYVGGAGYERFGTHFPDEAKFICQSSDAILFGSVGGPVSEMHLPKWKNCEANSILAMRKHFSFNVNLRPVRVIPGLAHLCPLKADIVGKGVDILFVRELLGDCYFGEHKTVRDEQGIRVATDVSIYSQDQISSTARVAFQAARLRRKKVTSVDKANVLDTSRLWRAVVREVHQDFADVELEEMLVDNCAMQIVRNPSQFDVVLTTNMFGDILSDAAAVLPGSLGLLASASLNKEGLGLYEPPGGSAQDIAGTGTANPVAQILCVALMLRHSFGLADEAAAVERAVEETLTSGYRTRDIYLTAEKDGRLVDCEGMADAILSHLNAERLALAGG